MDLKHSTSVKTCFGCPKLWTNSFGKKLLHWQCRLKQMSGVSESESLGIWNREEMEVGIEKEDFAEVELRITPQFLHHHLPNFRTEWTVLVITTIKLFLRASSDLENCTWFQLSAWDVKKQSPHTWDAKPAAFFFLEPDYHFSKTH